MTKKANRIEIIDRKDITENSNRSKDPPRERGKSWQAEQQAERQDSMVD
jgi:hypothetical protein